MPNLIIGDDYLWAATVLSSRSFSSRVLNAIAPEFAVSNDASSHDSTSEMESLTTDPSDPILIPVMDMLNHCPNHPVTWLTSPNTITFIAETSYLVDTEVFNNYGPKGNEECFSPQYANADI